VIDACIVSSEPGERKSGTLTITFFQNLEIDSGWFAASDQAEKNRLQYAMMIKRPEVDRLIR
jgi:hypothetical protein